MTRKKQAERAPAPKRTGKGSNRIKDRLAALPLDDAPTLAPAGLTPIQWQFVQQYAVDLNGTQAYLRASGGECLEATAATAAYHLLRDPNVVREIQRILTERSIRTGITADRVLVRLWQIATADARKLVEYRIGSCRHCWGMYHQYHWTESEFSAAQDKHIREEADKAKKKPGYEPKPFHEKGGPGYDPNRPPHPECPECWGRGQGMPIIHDTRELTDGEAMLFAGLKVTKDGVNVVIEDRAAYLQLVGRHLGMWNDKLKVTEETNPLMALLAEIQQAHSTLPVVAKDPELIEDAAIKPTAPGAVFEGKTAWKAAKP